MKDNSKKIVKFTSICVLTIIIMCNITFAHSGRTDSNGGHRDNKNKSGLGSYHYHCGGHPAHLHTNGICPYSNNSATSTNKGNTSDSSTATNTNKGNTSNSSTATNANKENALNSSTTTNINVENISNFSTGSTQVNEDKKDGNSNTMSSTINENSTNKVSDSSSENSDLIGTMISLGILGGGGYLWYKKRKGG